MEEYFRINQAFHNRVEPNMSRREARYLFFRMACPIMQSKLGRFLDLTKIPATFIHGNPHLDNYVRTFHGSAMMDFDRSRIGPYCWDIIRFLSSISFVIKERTVKNTAYKTSDAGIIIFPNSINASIRINSGSKVFKI